MGAAATGRLQSTGNTPAAAAGMWGVALPCWRDVSTAAVEDIGTAAARMDEAAGAATTRFCTMAAVLLLLLLWLRLL